MRCPYCNIHYMDDEKICPICGKRAGTAALHKERANTDRPIPQPVSKPSPKKPKAAVSSSGWNAPPSSKSNSAAKKKKAGGFGCFLLVILLLSVVTLIGLAQPVYHSDGLLDSLSSDVLDRFDALDAYDDMDDLDDDPFVSSYDQPVECMVGTWEQEETGELLTVHDDGSVTITSDGSSCTAQPNDSFFRVLDVDEDNAEDYLASRNAALIDNYPPEDYYYCELIVYPTDDDGALLYEQTRDLLVYLPRDLYDSAEPAEVGTVLEAYDHANDSEKGSYVHYVMQPTE